MINLKVVKKVKEVEIFLKEKLKIYVRIWTQLKVNSLYNMLMRLQKIIDNLWMI